MYECFHCGARAVIWDSDADAADAGYLCDGILHFLHCTRCGAEIEYYIKADYEQDEELKEDE